MDKSSSTDKSAETPNPPATSRVSSDEIPALPEFTPAPMPHFQWGILTGEDFHRIIHGAYVEIVKWKRNVFLVPSGKAGKQFVREITTLLLAYAQRFALESVAMEALM